MPSEVSELLKELNMASWRKHDKLWPKTRAVIEAAAGAPHDELVAEALAAWVAKAREVTRG